MQIFSFGDYTDGIGFKVLEERRVRASAGIMFILGLIAFINGFVLSKFEIIPYISGFLLLNFIIAVLVNPKFAPSYALAWIFVFRQSKLNIGAVQKRFVWSLGIGLSGLIFGLSLFLLTDVSYFEPVCFLCIICLLLLFFESAFGICIGCKLYYLTLKIGILKEPEEKPNCMGDACEVE